MFARARERKGEKNQYYLQKLRLNGDRCSSGQPGTARLRELSDGERARTKGNVRQAGAFITGNLGEETPEPQAFALAKQLRAVVDDS